MASSRRTVRRLLVASCVPVLVALGPTAAVAAPQAGGHGPSQSKVPTHESPRQAGPKSHGEVGGGKAATPKHRAGAPHGKAKGHAAASRRTPAGARPNQGGEGTATPGRQGPGKAAPHSNGPSVLEVPAPVLQRPQGEAEPLWTPRLEVPAPQPEPAPPATSPAPAPRPAVVPRAVDARKPASPPAPETVPAPPQPQADAPVVAQPPGWPRSLGEGLGTVLDRVGQTVDRVVPDPLGPLREPLAHLVPLLLAVLGAFLALQRGIGRGLGHVPMVASPARRHTVLRD